MPNSKHTGRAKIDLPGAHKLWLRTSTGYAAYWYAWRGKDAPRIWSWRGPSKAEGERAAVTAAAEIAERFAAAMTMAPPEPKSDTVRDLLDGFEASSAFRETAESTKAERVRMLKDMRESAIAKIPTKYLAAKGARRAIKEYQEETGEKRGPRAADMRVSLLSRVFNWAKDLGLASANPAAAIKPLHHSDRSQIIWTKEERDALAKAARADGDPDDFVAPVVLIFQGACYSGLSRQDICGLKVTEVQPHGIKRERLKGARRARTARKKARIMTIPRTPELNAVLTLAAERREFWEKKRGVKIPYVFVNRRGRPWTPDGVTTSFNKVRDKAGPKNEDGKPTAICDDEGRKKSFHDGRGTFVTHMLIAEPQLSYSLLAAIVGWTEGDVKNLAERYVALEHVSAEFARQHGVAGDE
jgi:site-specific recombinase XerD